jgi:hypothetical protein
VKHEGFSQMFDKGLETVENSCVLRILETVIGRPVYSLVAGKTVLRKVATRTILLIAITISGCDRIFAPKPAASDLIGIYRLTLDSEDFLRTRKGYHSFPASTVELRSDFGISVRNLPDCATDSFGKSNGRFVSGDGKWRLEKAFIGYTLTLDIQDGGSLAAGIYTGDWIAIRRRYAPHILEITVGDPDSDESIKYERTSS